MCKKLQVTEKGHRAGETHPCAKLTDEQVDLIREQHDQGIGYRRLARMFDTPKSTIRDIVLCRRRYAVPMR